MAQPRIEGQEIGTGTYPGKLYINLYNFFIIIYHNYKLSHDFSLITTKARQSPQAVLGWIRSLGRSTLQGARQDPAPGRTHAMALGGMQAQAQVQGESPYAPPSSPWQSEKVAHCHQCCVFCGHWSHNDQYDNWRMRWWLQYHATSIAVVQLAKLLGTHHQGYHWAPQTVPYIAGALGARN